MRWETQPWRKLYVREEGSFAGLPLYVRALAAELIKVVDDDGRLFVGAREPWEAIARKAGADTGDRRMLRKDVPKLIADGYLVREGDYIRIRNYVEAQARVRVRGARADDEPSTNGARAEREPDANRARTEHESDTNQTRTEHEPSTKVEPSPRNDSAQPLAYADARSDQIRSDQNRSETKRSDLSDARAGAYGPDVRAVLAKLLEHPALEPVANPEVAMSLLATVVAGKRTLPDALAALDEAGAKEGSRVAAEGAQPVGKLAVWLQACVSAGPRRAPASTPRGGSEVTDDGRAALELWQRIYASSQRGYGSYTAGPRDLAIASHLAAHARGLAEERVRSHGGDAERLATRTLERWCKGYLRDDGDKQWLIERKHALEHLARRIPEYGTPWGQASAPAPSVEPGRRPTPEEIAEADAERARAFASAAAIGRGGVGAPVARPGSPARRPHGQEPPIAGAS